MVFDGGDGGFVLRIVEERFTSCCCDGVAEVLMWMFVVEMVDGC